jgi:hypothetical protein
MMDGRVVQQEYFVPPTHFFPNRADIFTGQCAFVTRLFSFRKQSGCMFSLFSPALSASRSVFSQDQDVLPSVVYLPFLFIP